MIKYTELPEFIEGSAALNELVASIEKFQTTKEKSVESITSVAKKIYAELNTATQKLDDVRAQLVSEEIYQGKSTVATAKKLDAANEDVNRIKSTMDAVSRMGGIAIVELEKKLQKLTMDREEIIGITRSINEKPESDLKGGEVRKRALLKEQNKKMAEVLDEIDKVTGILNVLKEYQNKYGTLILADSETVKAAKECIAIAAQAWNTRYKMSLKLVKKIEDNDNEIRRLQEESIALNEALMTTDPDSVSDYIYASELELIVWPELRNIDDSTYFVKNKTRSKIKCLAQADTSI